MDRELEALDKARGHVASIAALAETANAHLREGRFEDAWHFQQSSSNRNIGYACHSIRVREGMCKLLRTPSPTSKSTT